MQPGDLVFLLHAPQALVSGLPEEDQDAIRSVVGKPLRFAGMTYGQAELEFLDSDGDDHTIWVDTNTITKPEGDKRMQARDFCFWLQGYFEMCKSNNISEQQVEIIRRHLHLVFEHEIDPSMGDDKHQTDLNAIHDPVKPILYRC